MPYPVFNYPRMNQFTDWIWIGCFRDGTDYEGLRTAGIGAVANLTQDPGGAGHAGFKELVLNQEDGEDISFKKIDQFLAFMEACRYEGLSVLIHCHAGISRTSSFLIAWLIHQDLKAVPERQREEDEIKVLWSYHEDAIRKVRPIIYPAYELKRSIINYFTVKGNIK